MILLKYELLNVSANEMIGKTTLYSERRHRGEERGVCTLSLITCSSWKKGWEPLLLGPRSSSLMTSLVPGSPAFV